MQDSSDYSLSTHFATASMLQLDHIFVLSSPSAPEADALLNLGMKEGAARQHAGQGTSNSDWLLSKIELCIPALSASETLTYYGKCDKINIKLGEEHGLKLVFNKAKLGKSESLIPDLPMVIEW